MLEADKGYRGMLQLMESAWALSQRPGSSAAPPEAEPQQGPRLICKPQDTPGITRPLHTPGVAGGWRLEGWQVNICSSGPHYDWRNRSVRCLAWPIVA